MLLTSATHKNIGLAILSPGLPPRATTDPDSRKQLVEADAIRAQQQALIEERRNQSAQKPSAPPGTPATGKRTPKMLSTNVRSTKRARAPPNISIDAIVAQNAPEFGIQSAPLYAPRGTLFNKANGSDSGPMTSSLYHSNKDSNTFPYSIPHRRGPSDPIPASGVPKPNNGSGNGNGNNGDPLYWNSRYGEQSKNPFHTTRSPPPRLPSISATFNSIGQGMPQTPPTPPTSSRHPKVSQRWLEGKSILPRRRRARSDRGTSSSEESDTPVTIRLEDEVTMTKIEWLDKGREILERAWYEMVQTQKRRKELLQRQQQQQQHQQQPQQPPPQPPQQQPQQQHHASNVGAGPSAAP